MLLCRSKGPVGLVQGLLLALFMCGIANLANAQQKPPVKLVLQITVDGLRGDLLRLYGDRFGKGGFRYLLENGTQFANANYSHANTETIVGHATLATGAYPSSHGMVGNVWFDRETGELSYNIEDPDSPLLPSRGEKADAAQLDPSQKVSRTKGRSPVSILASTFSDELSVHTAGRSKIFAVAGKDRSAVSMAGHAGKAFWYSTDTGDYVTSRYYYDAYPDWVAKWNASRIAATHAGKSWELLNAPSSYLLAKFDDRPYETDLRGYGRTFPHPFGRVDSKLFPTLLFVSPVGDQLTSSFAKTLIDNEALGQGDAVDYLAVGFRRCHQPFLWSLQFGKRRYCFATRPHTGRLSFPCGSKSWPGKHIDRAIRRPWHAGNAGIHGGERHGHRANS